MKTHNQPFTANQREREGVGGGERDHRGEERDQRGGGGEGTNGDDVTDGGGVHHRYLDRSRLNPGPI